MPVSRVSTRPVNYSYHSSDLTCVRQLHPAHQAIDNQPFKTTENKQLHIISSGAAPIMPLPPWRRGVWAVVPLPSPRQRSIWAVMPLPPPGRRSIWAVMPLPSPRRRSIWAVVPLLPPGRRSIWAVMPLLPPGRRSVWAVMPLPPSGRRSVWAVLPLLPPGRRGIGAEPRSGLLCPAAAVIPVAKVLSLPLR